MLRSLLPLFVVIVAGCSESSQVKEFKDSVHALTTEGRAALKMVRTGATTEDLHKQRDKLADLDAHVPPVPDEVDTSGELAKQIEDVTRSFSITLAFRSLHESAKQTTVDQELIASTKANTDEAAAELEATLTAIEKKLGR